MNNSISKYHLAILGCQMNKSDGERIGFLLDSLGYKKAKSKNEADFIIFVACSVRQSAINRVYGQSAQWSKIRKSGKIKTILTGCLTSFDKKEIKNRFDLILDIKDLPSWPKKIGKLFEVSNENLLCKFYLEITPKYSSKFSAFIPIMNGCNNFCSYCVVPYTRGREFSRPAKDIINEARDLISKGYKEIILVGQNVNSYDGEIDFADLLKEINNLSGDFWIRFVTSHPKDMSDKLIKTFGECQKLTEYFHIAVQSGNDEILKKMNRNYTVKHYKNLISKIKAVIEKTRHGILKTPMISTDIIVGFPSETEKQFEDTAKLMQDVKFDLAYISCYSTRPGTSAAKLTDDMSPPEKSLREKTLNEILKQTALEKNNLYINKVVKVLVERKTKVENQYSGKTRTFKNVRFSSRRNFVGQFIDIKITQANAWGLEGEIV